MNSILKDKAKKHVENIEKYVEKVHYENLGYECHIYYNIDSSWK